MSDSSGHPNNDLAALYERYRPVVRRRFERLGWPRGEIDELAEDFFSDVVIGRGLLDDVDGMLEEDVDRLVMTAVRNFSIDRWRKRGRHSRAMSSVAATRRADAVVTSPPSSSDVAWALDLLKECLRQTESYLIGRGMERHWRAFERRILHPAVSNTSPPPLSDVARDLGYESTSQVSTGLLYVKQRFAALMERIISECDPSADVGETRTLVLEILRRG